MKTGLNSPVTSGDRSTLELATATDVAAAANPVHPSGHGATPLISHSSCALVVLQNGFNGLRPCRLSISFSAFLTHSKVVLDVLILTNLMMSSSSDWYECIMTDRGRFKEVNHFTLSNFVADKLDLCCLLALHHCSIWVGGDSSGPVVKSDRNPTSVIVNSEEVPTGMVFEDWHIEDTFFKKYRIWPGTHCGSGAFGTVYRCSARSAIGSNFAIKFVDYATLGETERDLVNSEVRYLKAIDSPKVCKIVDHFVNQKVSILRGSLRKTVTCDILFSIPGQTGQATAVTASAAPRARHIAATKPLTAHTAAQHSTESPPPRTGLLA
ncbi:hypothetical protein K488DRAFT_73624 [Vararia minispora EC-137]|uniref:Uncharacterized protein n=1 Tax=Vararia minispora EC-137 TaxID=1314806 RepID=A0ACB8QA62_9AGAM|nr:hypothetical protein K488DRAFT_73624 [Vararia minispora EC-137]